jgi:lactoylglutathione lyase
MITDLGHAAIAAYDVEKSLAFYATLGIHEAFRVHHDDGSLMLIYLHIAGDRFIEVFPNGPQPGTSQQGSFRHICLLTDDIAKEVERLRGEGIAIQREITRGRTQNLQAWIADPDGNAIELMQLVAHSPQSRVGRGEKA